jgi:hypothetical protein
MTPSLRVASPAGALHRVGRHPDVSGPAEPHGGSAPTVHWALLAGSSLEEITDAGSPIAADDPDPRAALDTFGLTLQR